MSKVDLVNELHRGARKNFIRRTTVMRGINDTLQADLVEMIPYISKNRNMKYILTAINVFSKKAYARPLKNKSGPEVTKAMKSILDSLNHPIKNIHVERGKEFYNEPMKKMLHQQKINLYSTFSIMKAAIVERFNRTLKNKMWRLFSLRGSYKWLDILPKLIAEYNNTKHRTIKMKPNEVNERNEQHILDSVYNRKLIVPAKSKPKFKIGDLVRLSKYKHLFEKGYTPNWTMEVFRITKVQRTFPFTYLIQDLKGEDVKGCIYEQELQSTKYPDLYLVEKIIRRKGNKVLVKWLGFDSSENSWIHKNDMM